MEWIQTILWHLITAEVYAYFTSKCTGAICTQVCEQAIKAEKSWGKKPTFIYNKLEKVDDQMISVNYENQWFKKKRNWMSNFQMCKIVLSAAL